MLSEIIVRDLKTEDAPYLAKIERESFSMPWSEQDFINLTSHEYCCYVVAESQGEIVGCCGFTQSFGEANIDNVVVAPGFRGQGIAQKMLKALLQLGYEKGISAFTLEVRVSNETAIHVYEKLGFVSEGIRPGFYEKPIEDANIMWKR